MTKQILLLCGDYAEDYETMVPFQALSMVGYTVHAVCPDKKAGDHILTAVHDFEGAQTYSEKPGHRFTLNADFAQMQVAQYDALVIPGGRAPEYLRLNAQVAELLRAFVCSGKPIAAICHGAQLLALVPDAIKGRRISAYPACRLEVELCGAEYANIGLDEAVTDGPFVTAPAWPAHPAWLAQLLQKLGTTVQHGA
ncbi:MAG: DJ-1/PfpI family protein [Rhodoferax sp.]